MADDKKEERKLHIQTNGDLKTDVAPGNKVKLHEKMSKTEMDLLLERRRQEILTKKP